ncbi:RagB/SusD family nutrient uptake outer membrane protein [Cellulophaga sp. HaHaR_3_176]|uniref:RagB/SusD family nutrient uptake outer membrane protein n=1 Tax=Cellulophaga sp. HaHaR_3_176 TaxID=1942464 RepID=UPI001C1F4DE2|nr:RagB/SusD family nutrient uptake outer membrane protein [Cellulophaga sp. HaHaR_3_176]QWX84973.1 RagB/SusD family nutrient uptake outer membrane protein [Cellulophaga sp. HaHaR_3_176]
MKKLLISFSAILFLLVGCEDKFLDLDDLDSLTESAFFDDPTDFEAATNALYDDMQSRGEFEYITDFGTDFNAWTQLYGQGTNTIENEDSFWNAGYSSLRNINIVLEKAEQYEGNASEITEYVAVSHFFRAWQHFTLLRRFGGVPIVNEVIQIDSESLYGPRNSRYEVVEAVLADLDVAFAGLPSSIESGDTGKISKWAAQALRARVLLYEGTWEKYVGNATDFQGSVENNKSAAYISEAVTAAKSVIDNGGYELFNFNNELDNLSYRYLFVLEDGASNPAGLDKSSNKEFIIQNIYDFDLKRPGDNLPHATGGRNSPTQSFLDLFLNLDGLPIDKSPMFEGYAKMSTQFINRDYRMISYFGDNLPEDGSLVLPPPGSTSLSSLINRKFQVYNYPVYREAGQEGWNYPQLRLAEVYLTYAEALYERDGSISDADLNLSLNKVRERAGIAPLTNILASTNNLDMLEEIRRERSIELYMENNRYNDLKRWGIAEEVLGADLIGAVITDTEYENNTDLYNPSLFAFGTTTYESGVGPVEATIIDPSTARQFSIKNYLFPIPTNQIQLNPALVQNPGW